MGIKYGKLIAYSKRNQKIEIICQHQTGVVEIITDRIIRILKNKEEIVSSKSIEGEKKVKTKFSITSFGNRIEIQTAFVKVRIYDEFIVDFHDKQGNVICKDYRGERKQLKNIDSDMLEFVEKEGHQFQGAGQGKGNQVVKEMQGDECFYGLGDKTGFLNKRHYGYTMWNTDNPAPQVDSFQALYKSIPFFITLRKNSVYGLFFDNTYRSYFDMGKESEQYFGFGSDKGNLDYYYIAGDNMKEVVKGYTYLTGTVPLPQMWTLGYHQSRWGYKDEKDIKMIAKMFRSSDIPCDAIHLDIDYMDKYKVFTWDKERYQNPLKAVQNLAKQGFKVVTIVDPGVRVEKGYSVYDEGVENNYFVTNPDGSIYENSVWPGDAVFPDFGKDKVRVWWGNQHNSLLEAGVRGIWNDMNEPASFKGELPEDIVFWDEEEKTNHEKMHNVYGHNMAKATYEALKRFDGKRPFIITRACFSGSQKYTTGWTGDNHSIWAHLQMAIPQLCNLGLSGMSFVGTDIGGFGSDTTPELLVRWIQIGCFSPLCRNHSALGTRNQEPWQFGEKVLNIYRKYVKLRYAFIPYYYDLFFEGEQTGLPIMRPLVLEYEKDKNVKNCNDEFLIGENILVSPIIEQGATHKTVYLPEGIWYDFWTKEKIEGKRHFTIEASLDMCPIYIKRGSVIPNFEEQSYIAEKELNNLILDLYPGEGVYQHYQDNGEDFAYREGAFNQYQFTLYEDKLHMKLVHQNYDHIYQKIVLRVLGEEKIIEFENNKIVEF